MTFVRPLHLVAALTLASVAACGQPASPDAGATSPLQAAASTIVEDASALPEAAPLEGWTAVEEASQGDAAHGKELVAKYECNRCHAGTGQPAPMFDHQCVGCHKVIAAGKFPAAPEKVLAWRNATRHFITTPSLESLGRTLRPSWVASFLHEPVKIRPHEEEWMPRLNLREDDARDIAAFLTQGSEPLREVGSLGDVSRGQEVVSRKGCLVCHAFSGAPRSDVAIEMPDLAADKLVRGMTQAPDLRLARERFRPDAIVQWILDPASVRHDTNMPTLGLTAGEARDAAAYILGASLATPPAVEPFVKLPLLDRHVSYEEVASRVFRKSCTHCHADPTGTGDPGPGSTGGFGFAPRGVALLSFHGVTRGYIGEDRVRHSLIAPEPGLARWGGSRLVAALVARHEETAGRPVEDVRGMPMGLPGLSAEEIQLVETWVSEGAPEN